MSTLILFDVDKTLSESRCVMKPEMKNILQTLKTGGYKIGIVGGSDFAKQKEQLGDDILEFFDYVFSENGLVAFKNGQSLNDMYMFELKKKKTTNIIDFLGDEFLTQFIDDVLLYLSEIKLPFKRGHFIEMRQGMINISPCGRSVTADERKCFEMIDKCQNIRNKLVHRLTQKYGEILKFSIGGTISIDAFPHGWDKTFCLYYIGKDHFSKIYFFGDQTQPGGNDHEIYNDSRVIGFSVKNPEDTLKQIQETFF